MKYTGVYLRDNSTEIREYLISKGFKICPCANYIDSVWLSFGNHTDYIHGIGYSDEVMSMTQEQALDLYLHDSTSFNCGKDLELFVEYAKKLQK